MAIPETILESHYSNKNIIGVKKTYLINNNFKQLTTLIL